MSYYAPQGSLADLVKIGTTGVTTTLIKAAEIVSPGAQDRAADFALAHPVTLAPALAEKVAAEQGISVEQAQQLVQDGVMASIYAVPKEKIAEIRLASEAKKSNQTLLIGAGVVGAAGLGYWLWRRRR